MSGLLLGLPPYFVPIWNAYTEALTRAHIHLQDRRDELCWTGNPSCIYTPKAGYAFLCTDLLDRDVKWWWRKVWKLRCPTKAKLLTRTNIANKTPTWEVLQRKNHIGPGWCALCKDAFESITHLFIDCRFVKEVWNTLSDLLGKRFSWEWDSLELAWKRWLDDRSLHFFHSLPALVSWGVWIHRNRHIFEDIVVTPQVVAIKVAAVANHFLVGATPSCARLTPLLTVDKSYPWGFVDGAAQGDPSLCGVGAVLYLEEGHSLRARWSLGEGTNNKAELVALYMLLLLATENGIRSLQVFGDSSVIINWTNYSSRCHNILLVPI